MTIDYENELNQAQLRAVFHETGPVLVIAGAGSGKTRTLVYRVARLVEKGEDPGAILLLTFTRRAAEEMLFRASSGLDQRCGRVEGGTFHSFANRMLRLYGEQLDLPHTFTILDRSDAEDIISWVRKDMGLNRKELRFPKKRMLCTLFSRSVNTGTDLDELINRRYAHLDRFQEDIIRVREGYLKHKRKNGLLDYDDLLVFFNILLQEHYRVRDIITRRYLYVLVDEFQDTNHIQARIVELLGGDEKNVMAVGDDSQSIYSFRGARFKNIVDFPAHFPGTTVIKLEQNYRSTRPILEVANHIISGAPSPYTKCLYTHKKGGTEPTLWAADSEHHQSQLVVEGISRLLRKGLRLHEIAVLFRSAFHSFNLEVELGNRSYSFVKYGGFKFLELAHIKDVLAHLKILANPYDFFSWQRALLLVPGVGMARANKILDHARSASSMLEGFYSYPELDRYPKLAELAGLLKQVKKIRGNPRERLELIVDYYQPLLESQYDDHPKRFRHLQELDALADRFTNTEDFLAEVTLEPPQEERRGAAKKGDLLTLSTIHSAKGLEWKAVFILWAAEGWFPSAQAAENDSDMEEERRLLYVAVTRSKEYLFICYPRMAYKKGEGQIVVQPSRFIRDLSINKNERPPAPSFKKGTSNLRFHINIQYGGSITGRKVLHPTFGQGVVVGHQGPDGLMVNFESKGLILLNLKYTPLELIED